MNYPTGMGTGTGNHYNNVAAQMRAYVNSPMQQNPSPFQGQFVRPGIATHALHYGAQRMDVNPMVVNELGGVARNLMRNILHN